MAGADEKLGLDVVVEGFKKFVSKMGAMDKSIAATSGMWNGLSKVAKRTMGVLGKVAKVGLIGIAGGAAAAAGAIGGVTVALGKMAMEAAPVQGLQSAFDGLTASFEGGSKAMIEGLQAASGGMIANRDLMQSFNKAASLVSIDFAQKLPEGMQYLAKVSAATGQDVGYLMDSMVTGVGRLSPMILDNLGIQVSATEASEAYAAAHGLIAEELTKEQQQIAMYDMVLEKLEKTTANMPDVAGSAAQGIASFGTQIQNIKDGIGLAFLPVLQIVMSELGKLATKIGPKVTKWAELAGEWLGEKLPALLEKLKGWGLEAFFSTFEDGSSILGDLFESLGIGEEKATALANAINNIATWIMSTAIPALQDLGVWIQDTVVPAIQDLGIWIRDTLIPAFQDLGVWIQETAIPAFQQFVAFIQENAEPILAGIAAVLVAVVTPAFYAWATAAWATAVATVAALAPLILILAAIGVAVALLVKAWKEDWGGIQEKVEVVVVFLKQLWEEVLLPAIQKIWDFIQLELVPIFQKLARIATQTVGRAIEQLTDIWNDVLYPILVMVWEFIQDSLVPIFEVCAEIAELVLGLAVTVLAGIWNDVLLPALTAVWEFIQDHVLPLFEKFREEVDENLKPVLQFFIDKILPQLQKGFDLVADAARIFYDFLKLIKSILERIKIPDELSGHSPPPLAMWFEEISDEVERLAAAELPKLAASFDVVGSRTSAVMGSGSTTSIANSYEYNYNLTTQSSVRSGGLAMEFSSMEMATR